MLEKLPEKVKEKLYGIFSEKELEIIKGGFSVVKRPVTFRVNTLKSNNKEVEDVLRGNNIKFEKIPYLSNGYKLINGKEKDLWSLDIFTDGKIYIQGITSQLIGEIVAKDIKNKNIKVLDLAAAPGGKTSHISAILENNGEIIANEISAVRFEKLNFTIKRQGCLNVKTIRQDARNLKDIFGNLCFDLVIADLPCSAEGKINLNNKKSYAFLEKDWINAKNYKIQKEILRKTIDLLKVNGTLIYSTCTLDPQENEGIVHFLLSNYKNLEIEDIKDIFQDKEIKKYIKPGIKSFGKYVYSPKVTKSVRILPSVDTEGFFIAKFKKIKVN